MKKSRLAKAGYDNAKSLLDIVREIGETAATLWWRFFDWLAQVEWRKLIIIWLLLLILGLTPFGLPKQTIGFILLSLGLKVLAGGMAPIRRAARRSMCMQVAKISSSRFDRDWVVGLRMLCLQWCVAMWPL